LKSRCTERTVERGLALANGLRRRREAPRPPWEIWPGRGAYRRAPFQVAQVVHAQVGAAPLPCAVPPRRSRLSVGSPSHDGAEHWNGTHARRERQWQRQCRRADSL